MINVELLAESLVGITYQSPIESADIDTFEGKLREMISPLEHVVFVVDFRDLSVMQGELAERTARIMKSDNPKVHKSAFLLPSSAVGALQTERLIREAGNPRRRGFSSVGELLAWIDADLDDAARTHAKDFYARHV